MILRFLDLLSFMIWTINTPHAFFDDFDGYLLLHLLIQLSVGLSGRMCSLNSPKRLKTRCVCWESLRLAGESPNSDGNNLSNYEVSSQYSQLTLG